MQIKKITYQEDEVIFELIDGNKRYKLQINRLKGYNSSFWDFLIDQFNYLNLFSNISECIQTFV